MGFTKVKNIIKYQGRMYEITCDTNTGELTTNHPDGRKYIDMVCNRNFNPYSDYIQVVNNGWKTFR